MFKFEINKLHIRYEYVSAITEALGGSIRIVDKEQYEEDGNISTTRIDLPYAVARAFKKNNKGRTSYLNPIKMAIVTYDGVIVQVEKALYSQADESWSCISERAIPLIENRVRSGNWCTDGQILYLVPDYAHDLSYAHTYLNSTKRFISVSVDSLRFSDMHNLRLLELETTRTIVGFITPESEIVYSPPIWKNVMEMRSKGTSGITVNKESTDKVDTGSNKYRFDLLNDAFMVNLEFILTAGRKIGSLFGHDQITFLQINRYMVDLCTVNLPKIDRSKRSTYDTGLQFLSCFAWLMGFVQRCETVEQYNQLRSVFKVLSTTGLFNKAQIENTLKLAPPPECSREQAMTHMKTSVDSIAFNNHLLNKMGKTSATNNSVQQFITGISE